LHIFIKKQKQFKNEVMKKYTTYQPKQKPQGGKGPIGGESFMSYTKVTGG
jgi:hypothetical protein